jgi:hypothetical protein
MAFPQYRSVSLRPKAGGADYFIAGIGAQASLWRRNAAD